MIQKKICMVGAFAVGKTSLVSRFVLDKYSDTYLTTIGVKISRKVVALESRDVRLILWDLHGEDEFRKVRTTYMRGASGILLVVDGTRPETLDTARKLRDTVGQAVGDVPMLCLANKHDLVADWAIEEHTWDALEAEGLPVLRTSAKSGVGVEEAFHELARRMVAKK